ncbi:hypothetical protein [Legionella tunisiensis]|uniref:hypothetical protein n=1 Tax=Legionella tunisiensis TaxID=1034944 RepID=UPI00031B1D18|nr:hypothetical protein [Legionella tunisiensis]
MLDEYCLSSIYCPIYLFKASENDAIVDEGANANYWQDYALGGLHVYQNPGSHNTMLALPNVSLLCKQIETMLEGISKLAMADVL